jgi:hypothetical protein
MRSQFTSMMGVDHPWKGQSLYQVGTCYRQLKIASVQFKEIFAFFPLAVLGLNSGPRSCQAI